MAKTFSLAILALALGASYAAPPAANADLTGYSFIQYMKDFQKNYAPDELPHRRAVFEQNMRNIIAHNKLGASWTLGVNQFTDMTMEDMKAFKGLDQSLAFRRREGFNAKPLESLPTGLPDSVDWRDAGVITSVKNQGHCGSCWTFAATECLESHVAIATGYLFTLSEQEFVSCVENPDECGGTGGCMGATMELAYEYAMENGLVTEWQYPYGSYYGDDGDCALSGAISAPPVAGITNYTKNPTNSYNDLMDSLANVGPISITVDASLWSAYSGGIFDGCNQETPELDHGVLLVGYGTDDGEDYWLVRNSWGPTWGENGYIRLRRTSDEANRCGVDVTPADGVGCKDGPANVTVCGTCGLLYDTSYPTGAFLV